MRKRIELDKLKTNNSIFLLSRKELNPRERVVTLRIIRDGDTVRAVNPDIDVDIVLTQERVDNDYASAVPVFFVRPHEATAQYDAEQVGFKTYPTPD